MARRKTNLLPGKIGFLFTTVPWQHQKHILFMAMLDVIREEMISAKYVYLVTHNIYSVTRLSNNLMSLCVMINLFFSKQVPFFKSWIGPFCSIETMT